MLNLTERREIRAGVFRPSPLMNFHDFCNEVRQAKTVRCDCDITGKDFL